MLSFPLKKFQQANPLQVPQQGPYGEGDPLTGNFYISLGISLLTFLLGSPVKEPSLQVPLMESLQREMPILEPSFIHHSKSPVYEPPS
jgi:hypothetical protein